MLLFFKKVNLGLATFEGDADLGGATFKGYANFFSATFEGYAILTGATFKGDVNLSRATFKGYANLIGATFKGDANFGYNKFLSTYSFIDACFKGNVLFNNSIFSTRNDLNLKVNGKGFVSFKHACIENIFLELDLDKEVQIDFSDSLLRNTRIEKDKIENRIIQEKEKKFSEAKRIYLLLKNNFHSIGRYEDESWAFIKEKDMERFSNSFSVFVDKRKKKKLFKKIYLNISKKLIKRFAVGFRIFKKWLLSKKSMKWFNLSVSNFIYQYGENPWYVIRLASIVIFIFALLLNISGIVKGDRTYLILQQIKEMQGFDVLKYSSPILGNFLNCLYFSVVTFTTLGYGDFQPLEGWSRFLVSSEALLGAFTMALFVYTFARRTGGR